VKRLLILAFLGVAVAVPFAGASAATHRGAAVRAVCHFTGKTYVKLKVSGPVLRFHATHAADIVPAPAGACPRTRLTPTAGGTAITTNLVGEAESPAADPVGTGQATIRLRQGQAQVCYTISAENITLPAAGAHIHSGPAGQSGPIVVPLVAPGSSGKSAGCAAATRPLVAKILAGGADYYVNVHTTDFPGGAIRGQLDGSPVDLGWSTSVQMSGAQECNAAGTCGVGDPDGSGTATIRIRPNDGQVCFKFAVSNLKLPSVGAHIHQAARGANGSIVVPFTAPDASGKSMGCTAAPAATIQAIVANPAGFYTNVHTTEYPGGAIRAQLG
jgi:Cu/Zn superoxide dismutase